MTLDSDSGPRLILRRGRASAEILDLTADGEWILGRDPSSDLRIEGERVSRRHARLFTEAGTLRIEDLGSSTGVRVNGREITELALRHGDQIEIGDASFEVQLPPTVSPAHSFAGYGPEESLSASLLETLTALLAADDEDEDLTELLGRVLDHLLEAFEADRGAILIPDPPRGFRPLLLRCRARSPLDEDAPISRHLLERVACLDAPQLLTSLETAELQEEFESVPGLLCSLLACPLPLPDGPGVLYLDSILERRRFLARDQALLVAFSRAAGAALSRERERRRGRSLAELQRRELAASEILGTSAGVTRVREEIAQAAGQRVTVLVTGESGTGKELVARALHRGSERTEGAFVAVNCAAIPPELVESELFGHERGAFTGAQERRLGHFELADGGTLFLDEVGELPLSVQGKLLRVLQERSVTRLGSSRPVKVDFRLVCATNLDLETAVREGRFREDLFYRIAVFRTHLPPLRERSGDVLLLAKAFLEGLCREAGRVPVVLDEEARAALTEHTWPGNIRELRNVLEQALVRERGETIPAAVLFPALGWSPAMAPRGTAAAPSEEVFPDRLDEARRDFERRFLTSKLRAHDGNMKATAESIGLARRNLYVKCRELGIDYQAFR